MKNSIKKIFQESMSIKSFTNTRMERDIEEYLNNYIANIKYFKDNPNNFGMFNIEGDYNQRRVNWALVKSQFSRDTIVIYNHHDTVNISDYGKLKNFATDNQKLKEEFLKLKVSEDLIKDIKSDQWIMGRGSCDMKASLALQLGVTEYFTKKEDRKVNLLFMSVPDEESYSQGMRSGIELLDFLKKKFGLNYLLAIDSEPFETNKDYENVIHIGTVGKLMPVIVSQGILSHMKEPLKGINALSLMAKIASKIDLNPFLSDMAKGERSPLPSWNYMRDLKENYDVSTVLRAAGYFTVLYLEKSPIEIMNTIKNLCEEAIDEFYSNYLELQDEFGMEKKIRKPKILYYDDLLEICKEKDGFYDLIKLMEEDNKKNFIKGAKYQDITINNIERLLEFYGEKEAFIVISVAPPYNPAMNCRNLKNTEISIDKLISIYKDFLNKNYNFQLKLEEYFMGISDNSYCAIEKNIEEYEKVINTMSVSKDLYKIDLEKIKNISMPAINLGPRGKDLHKLTERVFEKDMTEIIPSFFIYLLDHIELIKEI